MKSPIIALITDFGTEDGYVGAMKGQILKLAPKCVITDISHSIRPYDIRQAAFCLNNSYPYFPDKTIFVAVVDPGVGTTRRGVVIKTSQHIFVGPDNGVFSYIFYNEGFQAYEIDLASLPNHISNTFHGRDVFSRIAALATVDGQLDKHLKTIKEVRNFLTQPAKLAEFELMLEVIHVDHFGNLILNFHRNDLIKFEKTPEIRVEFDDIRLDSVSETFGSVADGELALLWDSSKFLQIAQNKGNASKKLGAGVGKKIRLYL